MPPNGVPPNGVPPNSITYSWLESIIDFFNNVNGVIMSNLTKAELVAAAAAASGETKATSERVLNGIIGSVQDALSGGQTVTLVGFGSFATGQRKARKGRNPQTGKEIKIPASTVVKFRPGKSLKEAVNKPKRKKKKKK